MEQTDKRAVECSVVRKWNEMGYGHLQMQFFVQNLSDRVAKAERGSKTLRDHMKKQHMLSEIAENINPVQESESGRENAKESTAIEDERYFTNQEFQPPRREKQKDAQNSKAINDGRMQWIIRNSFNPVQQGDGS